MRGLVPEVRGRRTTVGLEGRVDVGTWGPTERLVRETGGHGDVEGLRATQGTREYECFGRN